MDKKISRRHLLKVLCVAAGKFGLGLLPGCRSFISHAEEGLSPRAYLPLIKTSEATPTPTATPTSTPTSTDTATPTNTPTPSPTITNTPHPPPTGSRVVHVHSGEATFWTGQTDYWNYADQSVIDTMTDQGMQALTGTTNIGDAWFTLLPNYSLGQKIAIKVNFNNCTSCTEADQQIDAIIQPVNAIIRGLKAMGVVENDIWVFDASRHIPDRFFDGCAYTGVQFFDKGCRNVRGFGHDITFYPPPGQSMPAIKLSDVLVDATYLINLPILKAHGITGVTLGFKHHFGSIDIPFRLHDYVGGEWQYYRSDYNPLVDIYLDENVGAKTVLTIGDGLFGSKVLNGPPVTWYRFNNSVPNSMFFSTDPVAIDCVMSDFLVAEAALDSSMDIPSWADDYLRLAENAGLGLHERGAPFGSGYTEIDYMSFDL